MAQWQAVVHDAQGAMAAPWLLPYRDLLCALAPLATAEASVAGVLNALAARQPPIPLAAGPLQFVGGGAAPGGEAYEAFIARTACVPTRDRLHDLFNGLVWLRFPAIKRQLNALQADAIARHGVGCHRGALRDALTVFDENAALWTAPDVLVDALRRRDWAALFGTHRRQWESALPTLFGHALLEKLTQPRKAITAHVWTVAAASDFASVALPEVRSILDTPSLLPLPVLGVPGWWAANEAPGFYADAAVFRSQVSGRRPDSAARAQPGPGSPSGAVGAHTR